MNNGKITLIDSGKTFEILVDSATMALFTVFKKYMIDKKKLVF
jgi:hypothetical protein